MLESFQFTCSLFSPKCLALHFSMVLWHATMYVTSKTFTFDAKIFLSPDKDDTMHVMMAVLHYYVPPNLPTPDKGHIYLAGGKLASVSGSTPVGEDYDALSYDAIIDATFVHPLFLGSYFFTYFTCSSISYQKP